MFFFFGLSKQKKGQPPKKRSSVLNNYRELQYLTRKLGDDNQWVVDALRKIKLFENSGELNNGELNNDFDQPMQLVKKHWIEDQYQYFNKAKRRDDRKLRRLDLIGLSLFAVSLLCGIALFIIVEINLLSG